MEQPVFVYCSFPQARERGAAQQQNAKWRKSHVSLHTLMIDCLTWCLAAEGGRLSLALSLLTAALQSHRAAFFFFWRGSTAAWGEKSWFRSPVRCSWRAEGTAVSPRISGRVKLLAGWETERRRQPADLRAPSPSERSAGECSCAAGHEMALFARRISSAAEACGEDAWGLYQLHSVC